MMVASRPKKVEDLVKALKLLPSPVLTQINEDVAISDNTLADAMNFVDRTVISKITGDVDYKLRQQQGPDVQFLRKIMENYGQRP